MYATLNRTILGKIETTQGVDPVPTVLLNAIRVEAPTGGPQLGVTQTNEVTGSLDEAADIPNGAFGLQGFVMNLKGSGVPTTAPECSVPFRVCGYQEEARAAPVTGTATAGSATSITLAAGASAVDHFYAGMPIPITGGTGSGQTGYCVAYNGTTKVATFGAALATPLNATSVYTIPAGTRLIPRSSGLESGTFYDYAHRVDGGLSRLVKVKGAKGTWALNMPVRQPCKVTFDIRGNVVEPLDVAKPADPVYQQITASPWLNAPTYYGGVPIALNTLTIDSGNNVILTDDPNGENGYGVAEIVRRRQQFGIDPPKGLKSVFDPYVAWRDLVYYSFVTSWGAAGGKRIQLTMPTLSINSVTDQDVQGLSHDQIAGRALGENKGVIFFFY